MTDPTPTDWRALCAEILQKLDQYEEGQRVDWDLWRSAARTALAQPEPKMIYRYSPVTIAECGGPCEQGPQYCDCGQIRGEPQPEPQGPSDEELHQLWLELYAFHDGPTSGDVAEVARAVLARWGRAGAWGGGWRG
jgi:hypothetical protein